MTAKPFSLNLTNLLLLAVLFAVSLSVGVADFRWSDVFSLSDSQQVMFISRLPRTFAIVLTGASMAVAGMIMQILMRNRADYCGFDYVAGYRYGRQYSVCRAGRAEHHQPPDRRQAAPKPACGGLVGRVFGFIVRHYRTCDCVSV